ncbi:MAG: hypothetical protein CVU38_21120 [Chloroflexi bacterium HGW-Chloroflexi-1]|nr:MAG: hypothetical protein CVU38_21120 [Chloroflexi bacterium HGW-Chloroflexi-1]
MEISRGRNSWESVSRDALPSYPNKRDWRPELSKLIFKFLTLSPDSLSQAIQWYYQDAREHDDHRRPFGFDSKWRFIHNQAYQDNATRYGSQEASGE